MYTKCRSWVHYLCEGISPNTSFGDDVVNGCLSCMSFIPEILEGHFVEKLQENRDRQFKLAKRSDCEAQKDPIVTQL